MNIESKIEFDIVRNKWMELAVTDAAKSRIKDTWLSYSESELRKLLRDTTNARNLIEKLGTPPLQNAAEIRNVLVAAGKGECLTPDNLEKVGSFLTLTCRLKDYLGRGKIFDNSLAYYDENLNPITDLKEEISRVIRNGEVDDYATKQLHNIRTDIIKCDENMRQKAEQIIRANKKCMADSYSTFRNGHLCVPVKKEYKFKVPGSVIDKSATGNTLFIEPAGVAKYYEELAELKIAEENEVYQVLYTLTAMVDESAETMSENIEMIEKLDYIFSKGKLSMDMDGTEPAINTGRVIKLTDARHPLMDKNASVPLQFEIGGDVRGVVITGPNTGGKTVAIKTVMLNCIMAQCGLHVTCKEADICMNSSYLCDIGDGQSLTESLSTFSAHITNVMEIISEVNHNSFVIMDELGSGTDPTEGMGIAVAILEELRKSNALFLVTTHYPEVKEYAAKKDGIVNARMTFDRKSLTPTYQMIIGEAGESCAFYIAEHLGMPQSMLKVAVTAAYGEKAAEKYEFQNRETVIKKKNANKLIKSGNIKNKVSLSEKFHRGDSVMIYPDKKLGIVCRSVNEKGMLMVQLPGKKIWINHKRVKLRVAATELYPEDYDFSIVFDTVENRKIRHEMNRKYTDKIIKDTNENS